METSGRYDSEDGATSYEWTLPEWTATDHAACKIGLHVVSRKVVVSGWIGYFSQVRRAYCACGRKCWVWYQDGWAGEDTSDLGGHLHWIEGQVTMSRKFAKHREWEQAMSDQHPCWGEYRKCISCGCGVDRPCVSHVGRPNPGFTEASRERMKAAYERQEVLRQEMWPKA